MVALAASPSPALRVVYQTYRLYGGNAAFYDADDAEVLCVGPAGTGKTLAACLKLHDAAANHPGARILMTRKTLESLKSGALNTFINGVKPLASGVVTFGGNKFYPAEFRYPNGSRILVSGMDKAEKILSSEFDIIFCNEATELTETDWQTLKTRLRNNATPHQQLLADCNPSGPRHWLNLRCNTGQTRRIISTHRDNPAYWDRAAGDWTDLGRQYVTENLAGLTGVERDRLYLGKWAAAEGLVYPEFGPAHIRTQDTTGWRRAMGVDVGSRNPTAILTGHVAGDGRLHIGHEVYRRNMTSRDILAAIEAEADRCDPDAIYVDPSAKGVIDDLTRDGYPAVGADHAIEAGIRQVHAQFQTGFSVDPSCVNLIDEFGMYAYPSKTESDKPVKEHDHAMDALRYLCAGIAEPVAPLGVW